jgi:hypothetical protein
MTTPENDDAPVPPKVVAVPWNLIDRTGDPVFMPDGRQQPAMQVRCPFDD